MRSMQAALALAEEHGIPVFPCRQNKRPYTEHGFHDATTSLELIEKSWTEHPDALIGVPTGRMSRIDVLDIDPPGIAWYTEHAAELAAGRIHRTRRDGYHLLYRDPAQEIRCSASRVAPGVDVRGEGGYVVWWPAHGCSTVGAIEDIAEPPQWLLNQIVRPAASGDAAAADRKIDDASETLREGARNDYLSREAFRLRKQGMTPKQIFVILQALNSARCVDPLDDAELRKIAAAKKRVLPASVTEQDFFAYLPQHSYIYVPTRELWPAASVNASVVMQTGKASEWLDQQRAIQQMTWAPGLPMVIEDRLIADGGWIGKAGVRTFNLYRPAPEPEGSPVNAGPWLEHVYRVYPSEAEHIIRWCAHRVQRPGEKINHAIVLGGCQGIGKDSLLEPVKRAIGHWNFAEVSPPQLLGRFNGFLKSVILRMSEARDLGDVDRYGLYEHLKPLIAAPPDVLRMDEKNVREYSVMNVCGVVVTTNHTDGLYLPADDRRHFVAWSELSKDDFGERYWRDLYSWYESGGYGHVAAYLRTLDISDFDSKAPPPKTIGWHRMVDTGRAPEDAELADVLDLLGNPPAVTVGMLCVYAGESFKEWLTDRRNARALPHRLEDAGHVAIRNDAAKDGQWVISGRRQTVYARRDLAIRERLAAATALVRKDRA